MPVARGNSQNHQFAYRRILRRSQRRLPVMRNSGHARDIMPPPRYPRQIAPAGIFPLFVPDAASSTRRAIPEQRDPFFLSSAKSVIAVAAW